MPLYGSQLWDLDCTGVSKFYVAWRKSIRYLLNLPRTTHCALLPLICDDDPISYQMCHRFRNFFRSLMLSGNYITQYCAKLALRGSRSTLSNSLSHAATLMRCSRYDLVTRRDLHIPKNYINDDCITASVIRDMLAMKHNNLVSANNNVFLSNADIDHAITYLCTM